MFVLGVIAGYLSLIYSQIKFSNELLKRIEYSTRDRRVL